MGVMVDTWRTNAIPEDKIGDLILKYFDLTPRGIMDKLNLHSFSELVRYAIRNKMIES